jgi:hypothetical protein
MYRMCLSKWREQELEGAGSDNTLMLGRPGPAGLLGQNSLSRRCAGLYFLRLVFDVFRLWAGGGKGRVIYMPARCEGLCVFWLVLLCFFGPKVTDSAGDTGCTMRTGVGRSAGTELNVLQVRTRMSSCICLAASVPLY